MTWITASIAAGGTLTLKGVIHGNRMVRAVMEWPEETPVYGGYSLSVQGAMEDLETKLMEDAAEEMRRRGDA